MVQVFHLLELFTSQSLLRLKSLERIFSGTGSLRSLARAPKPDLLSARTPSTLANPDPVSHVLTHT